MPNAFAFIVVFSWPLAVFVLFRFLPRVEALIWSIIGGYLLLPTRAGVDLPLVPTLDKDVIPALAAAVMLAIGVGATAASRADSDNLSRASDDRMSLSLFAPFLFLLVVSPLITVFTNSEVLTYGPVILPALGLYDAFSIVGRMAFTVLPFLLAARYLSSPDSHARLLKIIVISALAYTLPMLFEIRMSPQLNVMFYGFFPHDFLQHIREGSFRPIVFLSHGLWVGMLMAMAILAAGALWRQRVAEGARAGQWLFAGFYLVIVLVLSRNLGALGISLAFSLVVLLMGIRAQTVFAGAIAVIVLLYPVLRSADLVPVDQVVALAEKISPERAQSFQFRVENEDLLAAKAAEKPFAGWGIWGRNHVFDSQSGETLSVTDGLWIIIIGTDGWLGYLAQFGLLTLPILLLAAGRRSESLTPATAGLTMVLAANLFDLLPNATLTPVTWIVNGALAGFCMRRVAEQTPQNRAWRDMPKRNWSLLTDRPSTHRPQADRTGAKADWHSLSRRAKPPMGREEK